MAQASFGEYPARISAARWMHVVVHELRQPLQPLRGFISLARRRGLAYDDLRHSLDGAERQLELLQRLVDDLASLTAESWSEGRLLRERVPLRELLQQALEGAEPWLATHHLKLLVTMTPGPHWVRGDADRLLQVLGNLLHNAARYTPAGGRVEVSLQRLDDQERLQVRDNGRGLLAGEAERIFAPFVRGSAGTGTGGTGLGLAIVQLFVGQHGGVVTANSAGPGAGTCFSVCLPACF